MPAARFGKAAKAYVTTDHDEIREWAEERQGKPASLRRPQEPSENGTLRILFPGSHADSDYETVSWETFFEKFEKQGLAFLYQEETSDGEPSRYFKLMDRKNRNAANQAA